MNGASAIVGSAANAQKFRLIVYRAAVAIITSMNDPAQLGEVEQERLTSLDRTLLRQASADIVDLTQQPNDRQRQNRSSLIYPSWPARNTKK